MAGHRTQPSPSSTVSQPPLPPPPPPAASARNSQRRRAGQANELATLQGGNIRRCREICGRQLTGPTDGAGLSQAGSWRVRRLETPPQASLRTSGDPVLVAPRPEQPRARQTCHQRPRTAGQASLHRPVTYVHFLYHHPLTYEDHRDHPGSSSSKRLMKSYTLNRMLHRSSRSVQ